MKGKQLAILLVLVAVLGGAWYLTSERNRASRSSTGGAGGKVVELPINDVAQLTIKTSSGQVNLVRKGDVWTVQERADYPASFEQVSDLLRKFWDLKTVQEVKAGPSQLPRLELVEPGKGDNAGTLVEFKDKDGKTLNALLLGKKHMRKSEGGPMDFGGFPAGRYVKVLSGTKISLVSEPLEEADPKPERWLQKDFLKIDGPKTITLAGQTDAQRWSVTRDSAAGEWKLADAKPDEKIDPAKTTPLASVFAAPSFNDVLAADAKPEDTGLDKPTVATIETFDGFRYELKIGKANGEARPVLISVSASFPKERTPVADEKPEDKTRLDEEFKAKQKTLEEKLAKEKKFEGRPFLIPNFAVEPLLKDRAGLLPDKPAETTATPPPPGMPPHPPGATQPVTVTTPPITVTTPPVTIPAQPPKNEAVTPPVKVEAVTPPVQAPPLPPTPLPPAKEMPPEPPKETPPAPAPPAPAKEAPPAPPEPSKEAPPAPPEPPKEVPPAPPKEAPQPAPEPTPEKSEPAPKQ
jgi:hypothetical protein